MGRSDRQLRLGLHRLERDERVRVGDAADPGRVDLLVRLSVTQVVLVLVQALELLR